LQWYAFPTCRLRVKDFHQDGELATLTINEKGNKYRTIGIHFAAGEALNEYLAKAGLEAGPVFRPAAPYTALNWEQGL
jgi:integrase